MRLPEVLLEGLEPARDYDIWVRSLRGAEASEARGVRARTCEFLASQAAAHPWAEVPPWFPKPSMGWRTPDLIWQLAQPWPPPVLSPYAWGGVAAGP